MTQLDSSPDAGTDSDVLEAAKATALAGIKDLLAAARQVETACERFASTLSQLATEATAGRLNVNGMSNIDKILLSEAGVEDPDIDGTTLTAADMTRVAAAINKMSATERRVFNLLLDECKSPLEAAYLVKTLSVGYDLATVARMDELIHQHGDDPEWLTERLSPLIGAYPGIWDQDQRPWCLATTTIMGRVSIDPLYALALTTGGHPEDPRYNTDDAREKRWIEEQDRLTDLPRQAADTLFGPLIRGTWSFGAQSDAQFGERTGADYETVHIFGNSGRLHDKLPRIRESLDNGHPVPLGVRVKRGLGTVISGHAMIILDRAPNSLRILNPWGYTSWVSEDDFVAGDLSGLGADFWLQDVMVPK